MRLQQLIKKYIPEGKELLYLKKAGLSKNLIYMWRTKKSSPSTLSIIYLAMVSAREEDIDYRACVVEGIRAAAKNG